MKKKKGKKKKKMGKNPYLVRIYLRGDKKAVQ